MIKLPTVSGTRLVSILETIGYQSVRQKGSHIRLTHPTRRPISVPKHKEVGRDLLRKILRDADVSVAEFQQLNDE